MRVLDNFVRVSDPCRSLLAYVFLSVFLTCLRVRLVAVEHMRLFNLQMSNLCVELLSEHAQVVKWLSTSHRFRLERTPRSCEQIPTGALCLGGPSATAINVHLSSGTKTGRVLVSTRVVLAWALYSTQHPARIQRPQSGRALQTEMVTLLNYNLKNADHNHWKTQRQTCI